MTTLHIEVSDELGALLQHEAFENETSPEVVARNLLRSKMEDIEKQRALFQAELEAACKAFDVAKARSESEEKLALLDEAIDEVIDKVDVFELDLRGAVSPEDCVSWEDVKSHLHARKDETKASAQ